MDLKISSAESGHCRNNRRRAFHAENPRRAYRFKGARTWVSGPQLMRECAPSIDASKVVPDRDTPTTNIGSFVTL